MKTWHMTLTPSHADPTFKTSLETSCPERPLAKWLLNNAWELMQHYKYLLQHGIRTLPWYYPLHSQLITHSCGVKIKGEAMSQFI